MYSDNCFSLSFSIKNLTKFILSSCVLMIVSSFFQYPDVSLITKDIYNKIVQTAIDNYNQMKENREKSGGNYYNTMGSRLDGNFVKALCESISMGRTSYTEAYRLTNTSRKTFSEVAQHFGGMEW